MLILFSIPLLLSLTLVVLERIWSRILFLLLAAGLVAANVDTVVRIRAVARVTRSTTLLVNEIVGSVAVVGIITIPWILGGFHPTTEDLTWAILLSFVTGFASICAMVLFAFDITRIEATEAANDAADTR